MPIAMTRKERLTAVFEGRTPDRTPVKVWGAAPGPGNVGPSFEPVRELAAAKTDLVISRGSAFNVYCGIHGEKLVETHEEPTKSPEWINRVTVWHTPEGDLREVHIRSTCRRPGYVKEHLIKEPADIRRLLSMPFEPQPFDPKPYHEAVAELGDDGIVMFGTGHAMYALEHFIGSENFALWSTVAETEALMLEAIQTYHERLCNRLEEAAQHGITGIFGWVGPELCIPPLMSPAAFDKYVFPFDKAFIDRIHEIGGRAWVHCHGGMKLVIERFADMGVDVLNPIEPPPMGNVTMAEAFAMVGDRMGLEGNIETHDFMTGSRDELRTKIHAALEAGKGRRMILCPSSGYTENVGPSPREIENWLFYITEGIRYAEELAGP